MVSSFAKIVEFRRLDQAHTCFFKIFQDLSSFGHNFHQKWTDLFDLFVKNEVFQSYFEKKISNLLIVITKNPRGSEVIFNAKIFILPSNPRNFTIFTKPPKCHLKDIIHNLLEECVCKEFLFIE